MENGRWRISVMFYLCVRAQCALPAGYRVHTVTHRRPLFSILLNKKEPENSGSFALHLRAEYLEDKACGNSGADNTGYVRAHSVHE